MFFYTVQMFFYTNLQISATLLSLVNLKSFSSLIEAAFFMNNLLLKFSNFNVILVTI